VAGLAIKTQWRVAGVRIGRSTWAFVCRPANFLMGWKMDFDGERIHVAGRAPDAAPIIQCKAEVDEIRSLLKESTSKSFSVRGVVVFLDWFVNRTPSARGATTWS